ncbi:hypothetical protein BC938DRAFT_473828 [Jimgerdemannia flammicorona]|uniref:Uncharacterized protein n=1 Tax=Jimgerdemannia flammicorona TaxID=994334 RepID=A0A433Q3F8_9FUNG|nr:hypothetical protein BC938DRAFT_473828 [Jimgerdemannia flammicorona]
MEKQSRLPDPGGKESLAAQNTFDNTLPDLEDLLFPSGRNLRDPVVVADHDDHELPSSMVTPCKRCLHDEPGDEIGIVSPEFKRPALGKKKPSKFSASKSPIQDASPTSGMAPEETMVTPQPTSLSSSELFFLGKPSTSAVDRDEQEGENDNDDDDDAEPESTPTKLVHTSTIWGPANRIQISTLIASLLDWLEHEIEVRGAVDFALPLEIVGRRSRGREGDRARRLLINETEALVGLKEDARGGGDILREGVRTRETSFVEKAVIMPLEHSTDTSDKDEENSSLFLSATDKRAEVVATPGLVKSDCVPWVNKDERSTSGQACRLTRRNTPVPRTDIWHLENSATVVTHNRSQPPYFAHDRLPSLTPTQSLRKQKVSSPSSFKDTTISNPRRPIFRDVTNVSSAHDFGSSARPTQSLSNVCHDRGASSSSYLFRDTSNSPNAAKPPNLPRTTTLDLESIGGSSAVGEPVMRKTCDEPSSSCTTVDEDAEKLGANVVKPALELHNSSQTRGRHSGSYPTLSSDPPIKVETVLMERIDEIDSDKRAAATCHLPRAHVKDAIGVKMACLRHEGPVMEVACGRMRKEGKWRLAVVMGDEVAIWERAEGWVGEEEWTLVTRWEKRREGVGGKTRTFFCCDDTLLLVCERSREPAGVRSTITTITLHTPGVAESAVALDELCDADNKEEMPLVKVGLTDGDDRENMCALVGSWDGGRAVEVVIVSARRRLLCLFTEHWRADPLSHLLSRSHLPSHQRHASAPFAPYKTNPTSSSALMMTDLWSFGALSSHHSSSNIITLTLLSIVRPRPYTWSCVAAGGSRHPGRRGIVFATVVGNTKSGMVSMLAGPGDEVVLCDVLKWNGLDGTFIAITTSDHHIFAATSRGVIVVCDKVSGKHIHMIQNEANTDSGKKGQSFAYLSSVVDDPV